MFLLCALIVGSVSTWAEDYRLYSGALTEGDYLIVYSGKAMKNTISSNRLDYETVTASNNTITTTNTAIVWHIAQSGDYWTIYNAAIKQYAAANGTRNQAQLLGSGTDNKSLWTVSGTATYEFVNKNNSANSVNSNLRNNGTYGFACYSINTGGALSLYKKVTGPTITLSRSAINFGKVNYGSSKEETFTITPANLTSNLTISCDNDKYTVSPTSISKDETTAQTITVTASPTALADDMNGTITISGGGLEASETVTLSCTVKDPNANDGSISKPFTVAEALAFLADDNDGSSRYVKGKVSKITAFSEGKMNYFISDDGTTSNELMAYNGLSLNGDAFASADELTVGDVVVIVGTLNSNSKDKDEFDANSQLYTLNGKQRPTFTAEDIADMDATTETDIDDIFATSSDGAVTFTSSDATVANVVGSKLMAYKPGTATITASTTATATYFAASKTFDVTVTAKSETLPVDPTVSGFKKVTSTAGVINGDYLIVYEGGNVAFNGGLETLDATSNYVAVTISDGIIAANNTTKAAAFTYNSSEKSLKGTSGKYIGHSGTRNTLNTSDSDDYDNEITIDNSGNASIQCGTYSLRYNKNSDQKRFRYFGSGQEAIQLYRLNNFSIGATGWRTLVSSKSVTFTGAQAYIVTSCTSSEITLTPVASVKAGEPYLLKATAETCSASETDSPVAPTGNLLRVSDNTIGNGDYVLYNGGEGVGFYKWTGGSLGAGRVYLPAAQVPAGAKALTFTFADGEALKIEDLQLNSHAQTTGNNAIFNLAGQQVAQPRKGLYIQNGKKVIIK